MIPVPRIVLFVLVRVSPLPSMIGAAAVGRVGGQRHGAATGERDRADDIQDAVLPVPAILLDRARSFTIEPSRYVVVLLSSP